MSKNVKALIVASLIAAVAIGVLLPIRSAKAQGNLTNPGTLTGTVAALESATSVWTRMYQDQSDYPSPGKRRGTIVRLYSFDRDGGAVSTISLEKGNAVTSIPNNTIVWDGYLEIMTPLTPSTGLTNSLGINTAADILGSTSTNLGRAAGIYEIIPDGTPQSAVIATNNMPFDLAVTGTTAITAGVFQVVMECYYGQ